MNPAIFGAVLLAQQSAMYRSSYSSSKTETIQKKDPITLKQRPMFVKVYVVAVNGTSRPVVINASYIIKMEESEMQPQEFNEELKRWNNLGDRIKVTNVRMTDGDSFAIVETPQQVAYQTK